MNLEFDLINILIDLVKMLSGFKYIFWFDYGFSQYFSDVTGTFFSFLNDLRSYIDFSYSFNDGVSAGSENPDNENPDNENPDNENPDNENPDNDKNPTEEEIREMLKTLLLVTWVVLWMITFGR